MTVIERCWVCYQAPNADGKIARCGVSFEPPSEALQASPYHNVVEYVHADTHAGAVAALQAVVDEAIRDPMPHSSAWVIPAGAMDLVRAAIGGSSG